MSIKIKNFYVADDDRLNKYILALNVNIRILQSDFDEAKRRIEYLENVVGRRFKKKNE